MLPIVEAEFEESVAFRQLNAADGAEGQQAFKQLALPGHPGFLIFLPDGQEAYHSFRLVEEAILRQAIVSALNV